MPTFCSGCPHSTSTRVPDGSLALAGIGCHSIALLINPARMGPISHMGAEGAMWVGQAPFTDEKHIFANIGDGTYFHSGFLAIRQAVAAKVSITYKLLLNGFVSMTGGQPIEGELTPAQIATELRAEGVAHIVVVTDDPDKYARQPLPPGVPVFHRESLDTVQKDLRERGGVSVLIYDQMCATERRRQRKRGLLPDPDQRMFINAAVCEGCGDCGEQSNCLSVEPYETELGRKRRINQASCNKDFSCVQGFCPSFTTIRGGKLRRSVRAIALPDVGGVPEPELPTLATAQGIIIAGIGGTGVITVGAIVGMAAHLDGLFATTLDLTGLAQKYGAVMSHIHLARDREQLHAHRLAKAMADVVLGCDLIVTTGAEAVERMDPARTRIVVNTEISPTRDFARNPDWQADGATLLERIRLAARQVDSLPATRVARELMGDPLAANMLILGFAWQRGWIGISRVAIERAIALNGVSVDANLASFNWGRIAAHDPSRLAAATPGATDAASANLDRLDAIVADRSARLTTYQNARYAARYRQLVERVAAAEKRVSSGDALARTVARYYYKLLAYKDEFEVARLYSSAEFRTELERNFEGDYTLRFHLGAGPFARYIEDGEVPRKREVGAWMLPVFGVLARLRFLRGSFADPFRGNAERHLALESLASYEADVERLMASLPANGTALAEQIAAWPEHLRGYGHVRAAHAAKVAVERERLWQAWAGVEPSRNSEAARAA
jgi:indolepyruvate ferredoxin oxidoreductase